MKGSPKGVCPSAFEQELVCGNPSSPICAPSYGPMSKGWAGGSTRAWRKLRVSVLARDGYRCRLQIPDVCTGRAEHVHHLDGAGAGLIVSPLRLVSACGACNLHVGDPEKFTASGGRTPAVSVLSLSPAVEEPLEARAELAWDQEAVAEFAWLRPFIAVPEDASPPLYMSPPPADTVGSYGPEAIEWIESTQRITLRWWQALAITRQLEYREDGSLCHRVVLESCPRRAGKSVRVRGIALWRMAHADLLGETQTIVHSGSDVAICREIQRGAWRWAEEDAGWTVSRSNGKEAMETPTGDRWLVRAQRAVYGYDCCLGIIDEAWDVAPDTVSEGLEPATLERLSPQIHLTSTAHRRATSLMRSRIQAALTTPDPSTLFLLWAAPPDADPGDPAAWRAASPYWSEDRRQMIAGKYAAALAGEVDPQADDPDPMAGFTAQYLNIWRLKPVTMERGDAVVDGDEWAALATVRPTGSPDAAAVESWFGEGVSLALAWKVGERAVVSVTDHPDLPHAATALKASGFGGTATIGASLLEDPSFAGVRAQKGQGRTGAAVHDLDRLLSEDAFRHDGGEHLTKQVLAARTLPGADGPRMVSNERADALKAATWAAHSARTLPPPKPPLVVL